MNHDLFTGSALPAFEIFLGIVGMGFSIMFCTAICRVCQRFREGQMEREEQLRNEEGRPTPIFIIPYPGGRSYSEDHSSSPRYSQELHGPPQYSTGMYCGPPPAYHELGFKPDDLPPAYSEYSNVPIYPIAPPQQTDMVQPQQTDTQPRSQP